jgi:hypothetical protein
MSALNQSGKIINGPWPEAQKVLQRTLGVNQEGVSASEFYDKLNLSQLRDSLKAYGSGTGISNLDLLTAMKSLPGRENTPEGRQMILDTMQAASVSNIKNFQEAEKYYQQNRTLSGFIPKNYDKDGNEVTTEQLVNQIKFISRQAEELKKLRGEDETIKEGFKSAGRGAYGLATGDPEAWGNFATGAGTAAAAVPVGRGAMMAGRAALPMVRSAMSARPVQYAAGGGAGYYLLRKLFGDVQQ